MKLLLALTLLILAASQACIGCRSGGSSQKDSSAASVDTEAEASSNGGSRIAVSGRVRLSPAPASLPANAQLSVKLQDISLVDAPSRLLGSKTFGAVSASYSADGGIPFSIEATVPAGTPFMANAVAVSASLTGDGASFITDTVYYVDLRPGRLDYRDMDITIVKYP